MTFAPEQLKKLAEIGAYLQQVREEKSLSLEAIAAKTMIRQSILEAIEAGQADYLPEPIYTQGFIRRFAETLGLDGQAIARGFPTDHVIPPPENPHPSKRMSLPGFQFRPIHLYILYVLLVVGAVTGLSYILRPQPNGQLQTTTSPSPSPQATITPSPTPTPTTATSPSPSPLPTTSPVGTEPVRIGVAITQDAWLEVIGDGEVLFEGILVAGETKNWTAQEEVILRTGNAGAVVVSFNNNPAQAMGRFGAIEEKIYAATDPTGAADAAIPDEPTSGDLSQPGVTP